MRWDSCLESSSNKTLSRPSPPLPSRSAYCRWRTTESRGVVGPAGTQTSIVDWEPSGLHLTFASRWTALDRPQILARDRFHCSFTVCISGGATQWGGCLQPHVSLSSTESKYTIALKVGCEVMWTCHFFEEIGYDMSCPSLLLLDNKLAH
jgi:hypothetical protein